MKKVTIAAMLLLTASIGVAQQNTNEVRKNVAESKYASKQFPFKGSGQITFTEDFVIKIKDALKENDPEYPNKFDLIVQAKADREVIHIYNGMGGLGPPTLLGNPRPLQTKNINKDAPHCQVFTQHIDPRQDHDKFDIEKVTFIKDKTYYVHPDSSVTFRGSDFRFRISAHPHRIKPGNKALRIEADVTCTRLSKDRNPIEQLIEIFDGKLKIRAETLEEEQKPQVIQDFRVEKAGRSRAS